MSTPASLGGRVAVVTGGSGAIGGAIAARLSRDHPVIAVGRHSDIAVDLGDPDAVRAAAAHVLGRTAGAMFLSVRRRWWLSGPSTIRV